MNAPAPIWYCVLFRVMVSAAAVPTSTWTVLETTFPSSSVTLRVTAVADPRAARKVAVGPVEMTAVPTFHS